MANNIVMCKDGCGIPVTVCYKTDLIKQDRNSPTLVHAYGMSSLRNMHRLLDYVLDVVDIFFLRLLWGEYSYGLLP